MADEERKYLDLMNFATEEAAFEQLMAWSSDLSEQEHRIRSCIFDLHAKVEVELRRVYYHTFRPQLFITNDPAANATALAKFDKAIDRLGFMEMFRLLRPVLESWPYDLNAISAINDTRNQAAHSNISKVRYRDRDPFTDGDCFAQLYFDTWAITGEMARYFDQAVMRSQTQLKRYVEKYGDNLL